MKKIIYILIFPVLLFIFCNEGLSPIEEITGISGTIFFENWPSPDSLKEIRIVTFKNFPPNDIFFEIINGDAFPYPALQDTFSLTLYVDKLDYQYAVPAGKYGYLVIAHRYGNNILNDWQAAGHYDINPKDSLPSEIVVQEKQLLKDLDIYVDFKNLPIQPF